VHGFFVVLCLSVEQLAFAGRLWWMLLVWAFLDVVGCVCVVQLILPVCFGMLVLCVRVYVAVLGMLVCEKYV